jgi:hypothetical protein
MGDSGVKGIPHRREFCDPSEAGRCCVIEPRRIGVANWRDVS